MDSQSIIIIILSILCIIGVIVVNYKKKSESFQVNPPCSFTLSDDHTSDYACLASCVSGMNANNCNAQDCLTACNDVTNSCEVTDDDGNTLYTTCEINAQTDIGGAHSDAGKTIEKCITNCKDSTCSGCSKFVIRDPQTGRKVTGNYTNNLNDFLTKCDSQIINHKYCSPCVEACYHCNDSNKCQWIADTDTNKPRKELFQKTAFKIGVIPDDKKAIIVWNEALPLDYISNYEIFIYRKAELNITTNSNGTPGSQKTPIVVRRETMVPLNTPNQTFEVTGLSNGETYSINVNKVFNDSQLSAIKASNTVDIVPSKVNLVNFSQINKDTTNKQQKYLSDGILNDLTGRSFDIKLL